MTLLSPKGPAEHGIGWAEGTAIAGPDCSAGRVGGYGIGWAMMFPVILLLGVALLFGLLHNRFGKLEATRRKRALLAAVVAALAFCAFASQKLGEYLVYRYTRDANLSSYNQMPVWMGAVSASAPNVWEKALLDKIERVKNAKDQFSSDSKGARYSVGPDGLDQKGLLLYDPTNGVASPGDIPIPNR